MRTQRDPVSDMASLSIPRFPFIDAPEPLELSRGILQLLGTRMEVSGLGRMPEDVPMVVVSNHRSPLDSLILMAALKRRISFVCHPYMGNAPVLRDIVQQFGAFPLRSPQSFFRQGYRRLKRHETLGIFPEGAQSMVQLQAPRHVNSFHRGFAHFALRTPLDPLVLLPVALVSDTMGFESPIPLSLLGLFDPNEPLFHQGGGHPLVFYQNVHVKVGQPIWVTSHDRHRYAGRRGPTEAQRLTDRCWTAVHDLLQA